MTVKVFHTNKKVAYTKTIGYFEENNIAYTTQNLLKNPMKWEDFLKIISLAEDGVESLIPKKGNEVKEIMKTIDLDTITLKEFYELYLEKPVLLKSPIIISENALMTGHVEGEMSMFDNKEDKKARFSALLESVRMRERYELQEELGYVI